MKKNLSTYILIFVFLVGLSVILYPTVSNYVNQKNQSRAIAAYDEEISKMSPKDYSQYFQAAEAYNQKLSEKPGLFYTPEEIPGYEDTLDVSGTGIMGYITIDKLNVKLPIYHGTEDTILEIACGHLEGSSLPIGGESTHCVLSAHRGLPSAKLFTDLDKMEEGDTFTITVLDRVLTYEVDKISIVLPTETEGLQIEEGKDYCTLMTCTPYGINSHRLLVRGHRVPTVDKKDSHVTTEAVQIDPLIVSSVIAVPLLIILLMWLLVFRKKKKGEDVHEK